MEWDAYGPGNDPRCEHCGIHCGFEPSAAYEASSSLKETVRSLAWTLTGSHSPWLRLRRSVWRNAWA